MIDMDFYHQPDGEMQENEFSKSELFPHFQDNALGTFSSSGGGTELNFDSNSTDHDIISSTLFDHENSDDKLFPDETHRGRNISFGMHVEDREWNLKQAKHYEWLEKREEHEADLDIEKGNIKEAKDHAHSADDARKMKEQYIQAAKSCKK